jgi:aspartate racemase
MKKIGIVGGIAWMSTVEYYRTLCQRAQARFAAQGRSGPPDMPEIVIESINIRESQSRRGRPDDEASWAGFDAYFHAVLKRLEASGADFAIIASNTPHNRLEAITRGLTLPVLSIFDCVAQACADAGVQSLLLLGTEPTMSLPAFPAVLRRHGIAAIVPTEPADRALVNTLINGLQAEHAPGAAAQIHALVERCFAAAAPTQRKVAALACTELPLAFAGFTGQPLFEVDGVLYVNTTAIHAQAAFDHMTGDDTPDAWR